MTIPIRMVMALPTPKSFRSIMVDVIIMRAVDVLDAIPYLIYVIIIMMVFGSGILPIMMALTPHRLALHGPAGPGGAGGTRLGAVHGLRLPGDGQPGADAGAVLPGDRAAALPGVKLTCRIVPDGDHCEASWERQIPFFLPTLLYGLEF